MADEVIRYDYLNSATAGSLLIPDQLQAEIAAAGIAGCTGVYSTTLAFLIGFDHVLTVPQKTALDGVVSAHDGRARRARPLLDIFNGVSALTTVQQNAVWTDITSGNPQKWATNRGSNAAAMAAMHFLTGVANFTVAQRRGFVAMFVQDNPKYLTTAPLNFGVPGDEVMP